MKKSKVLLTLTCAVLLVAASVMGTLAYLTAQTAPVTNEFTVGKVTLGGTNQAGLDEAKTNVAGQPVDANGTVTTVASAPRVTGNTYKLVPGNTYTKDPTIHVGSDSEDCYLLVKVENEIAEIEGDTTIAAQMKNLGWKAVTGDDGVYVYYGVTNGVVNTTRAVVTKSTNVPVFNNFTIGDDVTADDLEAYEGKNIVITAYAVQADGTDTKTDKDLWALFDTDSDT